MLENLDPRWHFPLLNGLLTGADGGSSASNFRGDPIKAIGKENLQNPIDARQNDSMPARVEFNVFLYLLHSFLGAMPWSLQSSKQKQQLSLKAILVKKSSMPLQKST